LAASKGSHVALSQHSAELLVYTFLFYIVIQAKV